MGTTPNYRRDFNFGLECDKVAQHPYRPTPDPYTGELTVDPEIILKTKGLNLNISFFYSNNSTSNQEYGKKRSASVKTYVTSHPGDEFEPGKAQIVKGDFSKYTYDEVGSASGITTYSAGDSGFRTTLTFTSGEFTEHFTDGMEVVYAKQKNGGNRYEVIKVKTPAGVVHTYTYGSGVEEGLLKTITVPGDDKVSFVYEASSPVSLLSYVQDWTDRRWTMQYDGNRELTTFIAPEGCTTKYGYSGGLLQSIENPRGYVTTYMYSAGRVASMAVGDAVWTYTYADNGASKNTTVSPTGARTTYHFTEGTAALAKVERPEGYTISYTYDANGFRASETLPLGIATTWTYDELGVMKTEKDALGDITTYEYDSDINLTTVTNALGETVTMAYNSDRLVTRRTDVRGNVETYAYNSDGLMLTSVDQRGLTTTFAYDSTGNVASVMASDGGITTNTYDSLNRRTAVTNALGLTTSYTYNDNDQVTKAENPLNEVVTNIYDTCLLQAVVNPLGNRT